jgi:hypothetical protein
MTSNGAAEAAATLRDLANLEEAILTEMRTDRFGYTVRLFFILPVGAACAGDRERRVRIDLDGVHRLLLEGGLTQQMLQFPEDIDWGLGEVAAVQVGTDEGAVRVDVVWEGERKIELIAHRVQVVDLDDDPLEDNPAAAVPRPDVR